MYTISDVNMHTGKLDRFLITIKCGDCPGEDPFVCTIFVAKSKFLFPVTPGFIQVGMDFSQNYVPVIRV